MIAVGVAADCSACNSDAVVPEVAAADEVAEVAVVAFATADCIAVVAKESVAAYCVVSVIAAVDKVVAVASDHNIVEVVAAAADTVATTPAAAGAGAGAVVVAAVFDAAVVEEGTAAAAAGSNNIATSDYMLGYSASRTALKLILEMPVEQQIGQATGADMKRHNLVVVHFAYAKR